MMNLSPSMHIIATCSRGKKHLVYLIYSCYDHDIKSIYPNLFQCFDDLLSIVYQLPENTLLYDLSRTVIDELIRSTVNSKFRIKLLFDKPLNNDIGLNILRPAVLKQYFDKEVANIYGRLNVVRMGQEQVHHMLAWINTIL